MRTYQNERVFDLKDFLKKLIALWYWLAGGFVLGAVLTPILQYRNLVSAYRKDLESFNSGVKNAVEPTVPSFPVKHIFIGGLIGFVIVLLVIGFLYLLNKRLKSVSELNKPDDAQLLACFRLSRPGKTEAFADRLLKIEKARPVSEEEMLLLARLLSTAKNRGIKKVLFTGDLTKPQKDILTAVTDKMNGMNVETKLIGSILSDPAAIYGMEAGVGMVLCETVGKSTYKDLDLEIAQCRRENTELLGFVVFC